MADFARCFGKKMTKTLLRRGGCAFFPRCGAVWYILPFLLGSYKPSCSVSHRMI
jgi:hypothetical protein